MPYARAYSVAICGPCNSGKSRLVYYSENQKFANQIPTYGASYNYTIQSLKVFVGDGFWHPSISIEDSSENSQLKTANIIVLCLRLSSIEEALKIELKDYLQRFGNYITDKENIILAGTMIDIVNLDRNKAKERLQRVAQELGIKYSTIIITSAKTGEGVNELFQTVIPEMLKPIEQAHVDKTERDERVRREYEESLKPTRAKAFSSAASTIGKWVKAHLWQLASGTVIAALVLILLLTPGLGQAVGYSGAMGWQVANSGWQLGLFAAGMGLLGLFSPFILGYITGYIGQCAGRTANWCKHLNDNQPDMIAAPSRANRIKQNISYYGNRFFAAFESGALRAANFLLGNDVFWEKAEANTFDAFDIESQKTQKYPNYQATDETDTASRVAPYDAEQSTSSNTLAPNTATTDDRVGLFAAARP